MINIDCFLLGKIPTSTFKASDTVYARRRPTRASAGSAAARTGGRLGWGARSARPCCLAGVQHVAAPSDAPAATTPPSSQRGGGVPRRRASHRASPTPTDHTAHPGAASRSVSFHPDRHALSSLGDTAAGGLRRRAPRLQAGARVDGGRAAHHAPLLRRPRRGPRPPPPPALQRPARGGAVDRRDQPARVGRGERQPAGASTRASSTPSLQDDPDELEEAFELPPQDDERVLLASCRCRVSLEVDSMAVFTDAPARYLTSTHLCIEKPVLHFWSERRAIPIADVLGLIDRRSSSTRGRRRRRRLKKGGGGDPPAAESTPRRPTSPTSFRRTPKKKTTTSFRLPTDGDGGAGGNGGNGNGNANGNGERREPRAGERPDEGGVAAPRAAVGDGFDAFVREIEFARLQASDASNLKEKDAKRRARPTAARRRVGGASVVGQAALVAQARRAARRQGLRRRPRPRGRREAALRRGRRRARRADARARRTSRCRSSLPARESAKSKPAEELRRTPRSTRRARRRTDRPGGQGGGRVVDAAHGGRLGWRRARARYRFYKKDQKLIQNGMAPDGLLRCARSSAGRRIEQPQPDRPQALVVGRCQAGELLLEMTSWLLATKPTANVSVRHRRGFGDRARRHELVPDVGLHRVARARRPLLLARSPRASPTRCAR